MTFPARHKGTVLLFFLLLACCRTTSAFAFFAQGEMALVPMAGLANYDSNGHSGVSPTGTLKLDWKPWSADHPAGLNGEAAVSISRVVARADSDAGESYSFRIGPLWAFSPLYRITPLATVSFGLLYGNSDPGTKSRYNPFFTLGGGVSYPITGRLALRGEVIRFQTLDASVAKGYEFGVGLSYHFQLTPPTAPEN